MPSSTNLGKPKAKKYIEELIGNNDSFRILDLGCGRGTYGRLIQKPFYGVAVDAMPYKDKFELLKFYNEFHQFDIRDVDKISKLGDFDLVIMGDVLEHLYFEEARSVLDQLEKQCRYILVAVPFMYWQWGQKNHYENHLQPDLTEKVFAERYPEFDVLTICNSKKEGSFGYYIWEREKKESELI